jgi:hypothetical protein
MTRPKPARIGRPPRTDSPAKVLLVLPGELRRWLKAHSARERRAMGDIVADVLARYRRRVDR